MAIHLVMHLPHNENQTWSWHQLLRLVTVSEFGCVLGLFSIDDDVIPETDRQMREEKWNAAN